MKIFYLVLLVPLVLLFVYALVNAISTAVRKRRLRATVKSIIGESDSLRVICREEIEACTAVYGANAKKLSGTEGVFVLKGPIAFHTVSSRYGVSHYCYMGPFELLWTQGLPGASSKENRAEVVFLPSGIGLVIDLNGGFTVTGEAALKEALAARDNRVDAISSPGYTIEPLSRKLSSRELQHVHSDSRWAALVLLAAGSALPLISAAPSICVLSATLLAASVYLLFRVKTHVQPAYGTLRRLKGTLIKDKDEDGVDFLIDRFIIDAPVRWLQDISPRSPVEAEGFFDPKHYYSFKVFRIASEGVAFSLDQDMPVSRFSSTLPFFIAAFILFVMLVMQIATYHPLKQLGRAIDYAKNRGKQSEFKSVRELEGGELAEGREIGLSGMRLVAGNPYIHLLDADTRIELALDPVLERVRQLEALQRTDFALQLGLMDSPGYPLGLLLYLGIRDQLDEGDLADYADYFSQSETFRELVEFERAFKANASSPEVIEAGFVKTFRRFMKDELREINMALLDAVTEALDKTDTVIVCFPRGGAAEPDSLYEYVDLEDLRPYRSTAAPALRRSFPRDELVLCEPAVYRKLAQLAGLYAAGPAFDPVRGILVYYSSAAGRKTRLDLDVSDSYADIGERIPSIVSFFVMLLATALCAGSAFLRTRDELKWYAT